MGSALEACLFTPRPRLNLDANGQYVLSVPRAGAMQAAWRSLLYPGSGQQYLGRSGAANVFSTAVLGLGAGSIAAYDSYLQATREWENARRAYEGAETEADVRRWAEIVRDKRSVLDDRDVLRWTMLGLTSAAYLWNVVDAMVVGERASTPGEKVAWSIVPEAGGLRAALVWRSP
jgi:hypothetical protein